MKKKTVLIVEPPFYAFFNYDQWNYSYSCAYYAAVIKNSGHMAYIYDADKYFEKDPETLNRLVMVERQQVAQASMLDTNHSIWQHYCRVLQDLRPDVVLFSTWTFKYVSINKAIELTRLVCPDVRIAVGGYHATAMPQSYMCQDAVDAVFVGPSEKSFISWLEGDAENKLHQTEISKENFLLNIHPDRTAFLFPQFFSNNDFNMCILSRGCHHNCSFCQNRMLSSQRHVFASDDYIRKEIETVTSQYKNKHLMIADAHFFENEKLYDVLEIIKEYNVTFSCALRIDSLTQKLLNKIEEAGCIQIFTGIERGSDIALKNINKKLTIDRIFDAEKMIKQTSLVWKASFIIGFPDETYQSIEDTKNLALSLDCQYISLNSLTPLPGTGLWDDLSRKYSPESLLRGYNQLNPRADFIAALSADEYEAVFKKTLSEFEAYNDRMQHRTFLRKQ